MKAIIFDIEANGLIRPGEQILDKVHCICTRVPGGDVKRYHDGDFSKHGTLEAGMAALEAADVLIGHSIQDYDVPALRKIYPAFMTGKNLPSQLDTLVWARLIFPDIIDSDWSRIKKKTFPPQLKGSHSLEAWGWRLGVHKGEYKKGDPDRFDKLTPDLVEYCVQDTLVTEHLLTHLESMRFSEKAKVLEHEFAFNIGRMTMHGVGFDMDAAHRLEDDLRAKWEVCRDTLKDTMGDRTIEWVTPKKKLQRSKQVAYNPGSRQQVVDFLEGAYGWKPTKWTPAGLATMDEDVIEDMDPKQVPIKQELLDYFALKKVLGKIADGAKSLIKNAVLQEDGSYRIYSYVNHNGARTGRCTHRVVANIPRVTSPWGTELRSLFVPRAGYCLVGCDASGIEARLLGHYLQRYDNGAFIARVMEGDVHQANADDAGLDRTTAKTALYATLYGAGDLKLGRSCGGDERKGKKVRAALMSSVRGLDKLKEDVEEAYKSRGYLVGLDGRRVRPRKQHSALNTLIQCAGAVVMKVATNLAAPEAAKLDADMVIHYHDEYQWECAPVRAGELGKVLVVAIRNAGRGLEVRCPLDGEHKQGMSWAETH